jgi:hypothetical protein
VFFIADHLGSVNKLVDTQGIPLPGERQLYTPWGESRSGGLSLTRYQYTGQPWGYAIMGPVGRKHFGNCIFPTPVFLGLPKV